MEHSAGIPLASIGSLVVRLWRQLHPHRRRQFVALTALVVVAGLAEVVSLGAVLPFLGVLTAPERVHRFPLVLRAMRAFGVTTTNGLVLLLAAAFALAALVAGGLRLLLLSTGTRIAFATGADLSGEAYRRTLYQPYQVQVMRNSSDLLSGITGKVADTIQVLTQLLTLFNAGILLIFITTALVIINPAVAFAAIVGLGGCYALLSRISRRKLRESSQTITRARTDVIKALQEGIGGIRDVLLDGTQPVYYDIYRKADDSLRRALGTIIFISNSPKVVMESLGMVLIASLAFAISRTAGGIASALPLLGALALGAQRLLPALQQAYGAWTTILGSQAALAGTLELLEQPVDEDALGAAPPALSLQRTVRFDAVRFRYLENGPWVLDDFNLTISKGSRVGFVGTTGSGKSTALDLLMGLLTPTEGTLTVDDLPVTGARVRAWQRAIAHVPQNIFLADTSLAENIAFGVARGDIDVARVKRAAAQAQIADFIEGRPEGYDALVGERGIRLSGGQRQRIGIARALYKRASVLIFDEATSALDNATEALVMDAIDGLARDLTIVLIAHRLSTVRRCDVIVQLDGGRVAAQGTYEQLLETSSSFRNLARTVA
jgi:ABC-type multidrug transport system fused ATPase/permease subunit